MEWDIDSGNPDSSSVVLPDNWAEIRAEVLERDSHSCVNKGRVCTQSLHVHHIHPKYFGGAHDLTNLITLCERCHSALHIQLQVSLARRVIQSTAFAFHKFISTLHGGQQPVNYYPLLQLLAGTPRFRDGQKEAIDTILTGKDMLIIRPTGSGKSLIYQLPTLLAPKPSIVVSPLKALMLDQVQDLWRKGVPATFINSDLSQDEREKRLKYFSKGAFKLLYLAPERLDPLKGKADELEMLEKMAVSYIVVDEAHTIDEWGWTFRQSYKQLGEIRKKLGNPQVISVTATATPHVRKEIAEELDFEPGNELLQGFDRPNIIFHVRHLRAYPSLKKDKKLDNEKAKFLITLLKKIGSQSKVIVYVPTVKIGTQLLGRLTQERLDAAFFHGKLDTILKGNIQARFQGQAQPGLNLLIATSAFGMGIDIPDIRFVIHWTHPATLSSYFQQAGRAGRDQRPAMALILKTPGDEEILRYMLQGNLKKAQLSKSEKDHREKVELVELNKVIEFVFHKECLRGFMLGYFGASWTQPKTSLLHRIYNALKGQSYLSYNYCCRNCDRLGDIKHLLKAIKHITSYS